MRAFATRCWSRDDEEVGLGVADEEQHGPLTLGDVFEAREQPRGRRVELFLGPVLDLGAADVRIGDVEVDPARADPVRGVGDGAGELEVLGVAVDLEVLAGLEVHADLHGEPRVPLDEFVCRHDSRTIVTLRVCIALALFVVPSAPGATGIVAIGDFGVGGQRQRALGTAVRDYESHTIPRTCS